MRHREAMARALYGPDGFFVRHRPADHFRTSALASPLFARALARLIEHVEAALGHPDGFTVVEIGAGRGELLSHLITEPGHERRSWVAVELAARPDGLDPRIEWRADVPEAVDGVILACEWLDNVPLEIAEVDHDGTVRYQTADGGLDDHVTGADAAWLDRWWPIGVPGEIAEVGLTRDEAWAGAVGRLRRGLALAIDYGHLRATRPATGSRTGFRAGREVEPRFDGSTDITAHVALDSLGPGTLLRQRDALHHLGVRGTRPPLATASSDPAGYLRALRDAGEAAELTDPDGLGAHWWLLSPVGMALGWPP